MRMFAQSVIKKIQCLLWKENVSILATHAGQIWIGLFEHNADHFICLSCHPRITYGLSPGCTKLFCSVQYIVSIFRMVLVVANAWVEEYCAELCRQLPLCQGVIGRSAGIHDIT